VILVILVIMQSQNNNEFKRFARMWKAHIVDLE
jgi:hypothetical protein